MSSFFTGLGSFWSGATSYLPGASDVPTSSSYPYSTISATEQVKISKFNGLYDLARESLSKGVRADEDRVHENATFYYSKVIEIVSEALRVEWGSRYSSHASAVQVLSHTCVGGMLHFIKKKESIERWREAVETYFRPFDRSSYRSTCPSIWDGKRSETGTTS